jgi:hypothetical protein
MAPAANHARPHRHDEGEDRRKMALESPRCADAEAGAHEQTEIEAPDMHEQALQDVRVAAKMRTTHPAGRW